MIHNAQITTIHSFCLSVIRDHFNAIDIDPGFRIGEEGELKLLRHDVLEDMLEDRYQRNEQRFLDFAAAYGGGRSDKKVEELVLKIYEYSRSYPDSEGWLSSCLEAYKADSLLELEKSGYILLVMDNVRRYLDDAGRLLNKGLDICNAPDGPAVYEAALRSDLRIIEELRETRSFTAVSYTHLKKEMHFNMIVAYEQMKDWESAKAKLKEYLAEYPDDEAAKKELEFLETR